MKILFVDQFSDLGGAQICLRELLDETVRRGWQCEAMAAGNGPLHQACADRGIVSARLPLACHANHPKTIPDAFRFGIDTLRSARAIRRTLERFQADLIYVNGPRILPAVVAAMQGKRTPIVFHAHSYPAGETARRIARWCIRRKRMRVLAISQFVARAFSQAADGPGIQIVYNGVRDYGFVQRPRSKPTCIGIIGRISPEKGHLDFVRAARAIATGRKNLRFVIFGAALFAGGSYEQDVRTAAAGAPVEFRGWTDDVSAALHEIDILAVPSGPAEGATRIVMEAFSAGTPVVAYPSGGIPELVRHGQTGWLTRGSGHEFLADALETLLDDPAMLQRFSTQGRAEWEHRFRLERWVREVCGFAEEATVCGPGVGRPATSGNRFEAPATGPADDAARGAR